MSEVLEEGISRPDWVRAILSFVSCVPIALRSGEDAEKAWSSWACCCLSVVSQADVDALGAMAKVFWRSV